MGTSHSRTRTKHQHMNECRFRVSTSPSSSASSSSHSIPSQRIGSIDGSPQAASRANCEQFDAKYKKSMHKAHDYAYKFNLHSQKKQTLEQRQGVGVKYDEVAAIAKRHFLALLEEEKVSRSHGLAPGEANLERLESAQSDWFYAHHLAESWGYYNPDNNPEIQFPSLI